MSKETTVCLHLANITTRPSPSSCSITISSPHFHFHFLFLFFCWFSDSWLTCEITRTNIHRYLQISWNFRLMINPLILLIPKASQLHTFTTGSADSAGDTFDISLSFVPPPIITCTTTTHHQFLSVSPTTVSYLPRIVLVCSPGWQQPDNSHDMSLFVVSGILPLQRTSERTIPLIPKTISSSHY